MSVCAPMATTRVLQELGSLPLVSIYGRKSRHCSLGEELLGRRKESGYSRHRGLARSKEGTVWATIREVGERDWQVGLAGLGHGDLGDLT